MTHNVHEPHRNEPHALPPGVIFTPSQRRHPLPSSLDIWITYEQFCNYIIRVSYILVVICSVPRNLFDRQQYSWVIHWKKYLCSVDYNTHCHITSKIDSKLCSVTYKKYI